MKKYRKFIQLLSEYKNNPSSEGKLKLFIESDRLLRNGNCGHLAI